jgi:hypothetical protein
MSKLQNSEINNASKAEYSAKLNTPSNRMGTVNDKGGWEGETTEIHTIQMAHPGWVAYGHAVAACEVYPSQTLFRKKSPNRI